MTRRQAVIAAVVAALLGGTATALAQFSGQIPNNTVLGNTSGVAAPARPITLTTGLGANPTAEVSAAAVNGTASTFLRSDGAPALANSGVTQGTYTKVTVDAKGRTTVGATAACADLSDDGTACIANTGTSGTTLPFLDGTNIWSGSQTFGVVIGEVVLHGTTSRTLAATDCGKTIDFTNSSAIAVELPSTLVVGCHVAIIQSGAGQITFTAGCIQNRPCDCWNPMRAGWPTLRC